jgi:hypothetical protein
MRTQLVTSTRMMRVYAQGIAGYTVVGRTAIVEKVKEMFG